MFMRAGFEVVDARRRMSSRSPEILERVKAAYPLIEPEELLCQELEARLLRPIEPEDLDRFGPMVSTKRPLVEDRRYRPA